MKSILLQTVRLFKNLLILIVTLCVLPLGVYLMFRNGWSARAKLLTSTAAIGLAIFVMFGAIFAPPSVTVASINPGKTAVVQTETYIFSGKVQPASSTVTINGKPTELNKNGEFNVRIDLIEGINTIDLKAVDGPNTTIKTFAVEYAKPTEVAEPDVPIAPPSADTLQATTQSPQPSTADTAQPATKPDAKNPDTDWHQVTTVIDGDTFKVKINNAEQTVRVIGIDAPEIVNKNECYGKETLSKAKELLQGKWVQLKADKFLGNTDTQGKLLRYVYLDNKYSDYGKRLLDGGYAYEYEAAKYQSQVAYKTTQQQSQAKARGLWAKQTCDGKRAKPAAIANAPQSSKSSCDPNYSPCIPNVTRDLDCADIRIMVRIVGNDPHKLDDNGDSYACEEYR